MRVVRSETQSWRCGTTLCFVLLAWIAVIGQAEEPAPIDRTITATIFASRWHRESTKADGNMTAFLTAVLERAGMHVVSNAREAQVHVDMRYDLTREKKESDLVHYRLAVWDRETHGLLGMADQRVALVDLHRGAGSEGMQTWMSSRGNDYLLFPFEIVRTDEGTLLKDNVSSASEKHRDQINHLFTTASRDQAVRVFVDLVPAKMSQQLEHLPYFEYRLLEAITSAGGYPVRQRTAADLRCTYEWEVKENYMRFLPKGESAMLPHDGAKGFDLDATIRFLPRVSRRERLEVKVHGETPKEFQGTVTKSKFFTSYSGSFDAARKSWESEWTHAAQPKIALFFDKQLPLQTRHERSASLNLATDKTHETPEPKSNDPSEVEAEEQKHLARQISVLRSKSRDTKVIKNKLAACSAIEALGPKAKAAVPALKALLTDHTEFGLSLDGSPVLSASLSPASDAAKALGSIGPDARDAFPALTKLLIGGAIYEKIAAAKALAAIDPQRAIPYLDGALESEKELTPLRAQFIRTRGLLSESPKYVQLLIPFFIRQGKSVGPEEFEAALCLHSFEPDALARIAPVLVQRLEELVADPAHSRTYSIEAGLANILGRCREKSAFSALVKLSSVEHSSKRDARDAALENLGMLGDERAVPILVAAMKSADFIQASAAIRGLGNLGPLAKSAIPDLRVQRSRPPLSGHPDLVDDAMRRILAD